MDEGRADAVRRKIACYREYLAKGVSGGMALVYIVEITKLELLLKDIEADEEPVRGPQG
jgi:hypothetical protein